MKISNILFLLLLVGCGFINISVGNAKPIPEKSDSLKVFKLGDVNVEGDVLSNKIYSSNITSIPLKIINSVDLPNVNQLRFLIPSANIRMNSRGEAMMTLRGASERQFAVFFDGMPLGIPWDGRGDLTFLPTDVVGEINVDNSTTSMLFGPNILGGVAQILTFERATNGIGNQLHLQSGDNGGIWASNSLDYKTSSFNNLLNVSYMKTPGIALPSDTSGINFQDSRDTEKGLRTNTNQERLNLFARTEYLVNDRSKLSLSLSYIKDNKGVQTESYNTPKKARYWQYPDRNRVFSILNFETAFGEEKDFILKTTLWVDKFKQGIDSYDGVLFDPSSKVKETEKDDDFTAGARVAGNYKLNNTNSFNISLNTLYSKHNEITWSLDGKSEKNYNLDFSQVLSSVGVDYINQITDNFVAKIGASYDMFSTPLTGNYKALEGNSLNDYALFLNLNYKINNEYSLNWATNRRTRFPSMRESLSEALGKNYANPDLKPETGIINELSVIRNVNNFKTKLTGFYNLYDQLIVQGKVTINGDERKQRMNLQKADIAGVEATAEYYYDSFTFYANATYLDVIVKTNDINLEQLENRPNYYAGAVVNYKFIPELNAQAELDYLGYKEVIDSKSSHLSAAIMNLRLAYNLIMVDSQVIEMYARMNNIFDTRRETEMGILDAGRYISFGLNYKI